MRNRIELILNFATSAGYRPEGPNPAAWSNLRDLLAAPTKINGKKHHAALPYTELPAFLSSLRQREGIGARALEFTILTAARMGEVVGAQWSEIDLAAKVWTIPANRMKGGKEHRVPLSAAAIALLKALPTERGNDNVFIGARGDRVSQTAVTVLPKRLGFDATVHGFRSTFADWCHERTGANGMIVEMCSHMPSARMSSAVYRRTDLFDKRAQADGRLGHLRHLAGRSDACRGADAEGLTPAVHIFPTPVGGFGEGTHTAVVSVMGHDHKRPKRAARGGRFGVVQACLAREFFGPPLLVKS